MKPFIPLCVLAALIAPIYGQQLPALAPVPAAPVPPASAEPALIPFPAPILREALPPIAPLVVTQVVTQTILTAPPSSNKQSVPKREMSYSEYRAERRALYQKLRLSESLFRRSGHWLDVSFMSSSTYISSYSRSLDNYTISVSAGGIYKGFMLGLSYHYIFAESLYNSRSGGLYSMPRLHEAALVLGYRIAPDRVVGLRLMLHAGVGSSCGREAFSPTGRASLFYVMLMPELKLDIRLYKSFVFTFGVAYKGAIFVGRSQPHTRFFEEAFGFNTVKGFRYSLGLAFSY